MIDNKSHDYVLVYANGSYTTGITGTIVKAIELADQIIADLPHFKYVDIYLRNVHRARVYSIDAKDAGTPPIMYLSPVNQPLTAAT